MFAPDACPLPPYRRPDQRIGDDPAGGVVEECFAPGQLRDPGPGPGQAQRGHQVGEGLGLRFCVGDDRQHQGRDGEGRCQQVQQAERKADGRLGVPTTVATPRLSRAMRVRYTTTPTTAPHVCGRGEGRLLVREGQAVAGHGQPPGQRGADHRQRRGGEH
jgi:hypothetical protein